MQKCTFAKKIVYSFNMIPIKIPVGFSFLRKAVYINKPTYKNSEESCEKKTNDE